MGSTNGKLNRKNKMGQDDLVAQHLEPLWLKMNAMVPPTPNPVSKPHLWRYNDTLPHLLKAGETVPAEEAERRVLMLINPNIESPYTTDTIYGGLQLVKPGIRVETPLVRGRSLPKRPKTPHAIYHYTTKSGNSLYTTLTIQAERIDAGHATSESQEQASFMYHCYEGEGRTIVTLPNGEKVVFEWMWRDTFAVPAWSKNQHVNKSNSTAYLVAISDRPLLNLLQLQKPNA